MRRLWLLLLLPACQAIFPLDEITPPPIDAPIDEPPDAALPLCYGHDVVQICLAKPVLDRFETPTNVIVVDTDTSPSCASYMTTSGEDPNACVIAAANIEIVGGLRATGSRTLVLIATNRLEIVGNLDVATTEAVIGPGSDPAECTVGQTAGGRSGGGGGSFGGTGANGGLGLTTPIGKSGPVAVPTRLRGGCRGGGGASSVGSNGGGGGAVALIATTIVVTGKINASGQGGHGGQQAMTGGGGGGGGGSGGMIAFDGVVVLDPLAQVFANGGGGGAGAGTGAIAHGCDASNPSSFDASPGGADGGSEPAGCGAASGGNGGNGAANGALDGATGQNAPTPAQGGGGGGGGGGGVIHVFPAQPLDLARISPPPS